ncbi:MAG: proton-coupled thiamine transporter YuaJ, partial [Lachnospiraceae bacterium]|nr:proton-coupled thiamine transporter YuaJ [Lachnospiraceae bacterium]
MNNFFATPTDVWGDDAVMLTTIGICIIVVAILALIGIALIIYKRKNNASAKITTRQLVFSSMAIALAMVTSMVKLMEMPMGGSVTLLSMLFIVLIAYWYGPVAGITTGMAYGLLQFVLEPIFYTL